jgi:hypothetical protein
MKSVIKGIASSLFITALLSGLVLPVSISAESSGPSATGKFEILTDDGPTRSIEFSARSDAYGKTVGEVIFRDSEPQASINPETATETQAPTLFFLKAEFDCLTVKDNRAVMVGSVTESSVAHYVGRRFLLAALDNDDDAKAAVADRLTWGLYRPSQRAWVAMDSERSVDEDTGPGAWLATDVERPDDPGVSSQKVETIGCQTFPVSSFSFIDSKHGRGTVHVRP